MEFMDINESCTYPASALSNFNAYSFLFDDVLCASMEGLLQSFKTKDIQKQKEVCMLVGKKAKFAGKKKKWYLTQTLYWNGEEFDRHGESYQKLLDCAFEALSKNEQFKTALLATGKTVITHSIGKKDPYQTILTEDEFCSRLMKVREKLEAEECGS